MKIINWWFGVLFAAWISGPVEADVVYRLGAGDLVSISVYQEPDLSLDVRVDSSGRMSYPLLGSVQVLGLSPEDLEKMLTSSLSAGYLVQPSVTVKILEYRPFYVKGEVKRAGKYEFQPGLTVDKAISIAGGFTERASKKSIDVVHDSSAYRADESVQSTSVPLSSPVQPGDVITVEQSFF